MTNRLAASLLPATLFAVGAALAALAPDAARAQVATEKPPLLIASEVLPPALLSGSNFRVETRVVNDGFMNHYNIASPLGNLEAHSDAELAKRTQEYRAIEQLRKLESTDQFAKALVGAGERVVQGGEALLTRPVETVSGVFDGVGSIFRRTGDAVFGDPMSHYEDNSLQAVAGVSQQKREYAAAVGVDPYSSNPLLQAQLTRVARAAAVGNILASTALGAIGGGVGTAFSVIGSTQSLNDLLRTTTPTDLHAMNRDKLSRMGIGADLVDLFLANRNYSPTYQMLLVDALDRMPGVAGRDALLKAAIGADSDALAMFRQRQARMYAAYNQQVQPIARFTANGNLVLAQTRDGRLVVNVPVDYLVLTDTLAAMLERTEAQARSQPAPTARELWLGGSISPRARQAFESRGWKVFEKAADRLVGQG